MFKKKGKPAELVKATRQALLKKGKSSKPEGEETISKYLEAIREVLVTEPDANQDNITILCNEIYSQEMIPLLIAHLPDLDFEAKKDTATIFTHLLRRQVNNKYPTIEYLKKNPHVILQMVSGYKDPSIGLTMGAMLREGIKHESICKILLQEENFYEFFRLIETPNFDICSDSFATFKELLTKHKQLIAQFLDENYDKFFEHYTKLLHSTNYVNKRQSLKLLGEILLDRANFNVMTRYISVRSNLKLMMTLLVDTSRSIQFEAFHVFKVFVANPHKPKPIEEILVGNKDMLIQFLSDFHNDKEDEQFADEKAYLIKQIESL